MFNLEMSFKSILPCTAGVYMSRLHEGAFNTMYISNNDRNVVSCVNLFIARVVKSKQILFTN